MATLHKNYIDFNRSISLTDSRLDSLKASRKGLRKKIRAWVKENRADELQPRFGKQGSIAMNTTVNPIPVDDGNGNKLLKYDLDDGVYFIENEGEDNRQMTATWRDWLWLAADGHTASPPEKHRACIRVLFSDGHHIDLPLYYKEGGNIELAHRDEGWILTDPREFYEWFNDKAKSTPQLVRIVRYLKAWKNFQETQTSETFIASGFALTILGGNHFSSDDNDDAAMRKTVANIYRELKRDFKCLRPTTPKDENLFESYTTKQRDKFLEELSQLAEACEHPCDETNVRSASEKLQFEFGDRFPLSKDEEEETKSQRLAASLTSSQIKPIPYGE